MKPVYAHYHREARFLSKPLLSAMSGLGLMVLSAKHSRGISNSLSTYRWSRGRALSYHAVAPGSIPGVGRDFGLPVDPADIVMNG